MRLACDILYKYTDEAVLEMLKNGILNLGFTPNFYSIFYNQFKKSKNDIAYNEVDVF